MVRIELLALVWLFFKGSLAAVAQPTYSLKNGVIEVAIDGQGNLIRLTNVRTGHNYAAGKPLWRLHYDRPDWKDNPVLAADNQPTIQQQDNRIQLRYSSLKGQRETVRFDVRLTIILETDQVRFASELINNEPHSIIRELQYPLVGNCQLPTDHQLLTTYWGGQLYANPQKQIAAFNATFPPYYPPSQHFLQMDQKYPTGWAGGGLASNCFAFVGPTEGLYMGSHDSTFQDTGHGLRLYPSKKFGFDQLEAGFYKYPNCPTGQTWRCDANVVAPYSGDWHQTGRLYRRWVNTWWKHRDEPMWVKQMKGWQRIIMKHQYGEVLFPYTDLGTRVKTVGEGVGLNTVLLHGWHKGGHDNDYPNYVADSKQGGEVALKAQIANFQKDGGAVLFYYSGRLMDKTSDYYRTGPGKALCIRDNTGAEINDSYKFRGEGTFTGGYDSRTFAIAEFRNPVWQTRLREMADQSIQMGAKSVFYDQMGWGEQPNWDLSGEFSIPYLKSIADKSKILGSLHDYIDGRDPNLAIGIELLTDVTAMQVDYIHARYGATEVLNPDWEARSEKPRTTNFVDWFRYTFPEIILSDRDIRDDTDIERRVNHTVLKGLRNDVEIYRCRALIDDTPHYQAYLTQINQLKERFKDLLLLGRYTDTEGIQQTNPEIEARRFERGNRAAIVLTQSHLASATTTLTLPNGYVFTESGGVGNVVVKPDKGVVQIDLKKHGLAVVILQKTN
jgi:hypothetical protein